MSNIPKMGQLPTPAYALVCVESWEYIVGAAMNEIFQLYIQALLEGNVN